MAVYENTRGRLQDIFEVLKIDMNKFKSIWARFTLTMLKPMKIQKKVFY